MALSYRIAKVGLKVQIDHVHLLVNVPPKVSVLNFVDTSKGRAVIRIFNKLRNLKNKPYWGNHFLSRGYCVATVGLAAEMIKKIGTIQSSKGRSRRRNSVDCFDNHRG